MDKLTSEQLFALEEVCSTILNTPKENIELEADYMKEVVRITYSPTQTIYKCNCAMDSARAIMLDVVTQLHKQSA